MQNCWWLAVYFLLYRIAAELLLWSAACFPFHLITYLPCSLSTFSFLKESPQHDWNIPSITGEKSSPFVIDMGCRCPLCLSLLTSLVCSFISHCFSPSIMYVFGGFNSLLLSDVLTFTPASCSAFSSESACASAWPGIRCLWNSSLGTCLPWEAASPHQERLVLASCPRKACMFSARPPPKEKKKTPFCPGNVASSLASSWRGTGRIPCVELYWKIILGLYEMKSSESEYVKYTLAGLPHYYEDAVCSLAAHMWSSWEDLYVWVVICSRGSRWSGACRAPPPTPKLSPAHLRPLEALSSFINHVFSCTGQFFWAVCRAVLVKIKRDILAHNFRYDAAANHLPKTVLCFINGLFFSFVCNLLEAACRRD